MENIELITKAVDYAKQNATNNEITMQEIASNAGFSIDYFNRIFLSHTGFTVAAYVNYIRLKRAAELLRSTDKTVLEIALGVGYNSHEGFIKAFKKKYDVTPSEYREKHRNTIMQWGEFTDKSIAARFIHANQDFKLVDSDLVIDYLLEKNAKRYSYFCTVIKYMGLEIVAPDGNIENGFIGIGDNRKGGYYLEIVTDDYKLLSEWIKHFNNKVTFYSECRPYDIENMLKEYSITNNIEAVPQAMYFGRPLECELPDNVKIRPLSGRDKSAILKWANGKKDAYIQHLLNEKHYLDSAVLEYGVFQGNDLIAVAECGIDEVHGIRLNNSCAIHFADGKATDDMYRTIFAFVVNDVMNKGILPFDDIQYGEYAKSHGNFKSDEMGFTIVNWRYTITER